MDTAQIEKLLDIFEKKDIHELEIEDKGFKIRLKKAAPQHAGRGTFSHVKGLSEHPEKDGGLKLSDDIAKDLHVVKSPMVGTFYRAPSPTSEPYVKKGDIVEKGQILCVIEAMKIMNEIESDIRGRINSVLVENSHPVEYGEHLILIEPV